MTAPQPIKDNPVMWVGPILCCWMPDPMGFEGVCGIPIESEPCSKHGTDVPDA